MQYFAQVNVCFLQNKYPSIIGYYRTSCATGEGIEEFKEALVNQLGNVQLIETRWPNSWFSVKSRLKGLREGKTLYHF